MPKNKIKNQLRVMNKENNSVKLYLYGDIGDSYYDSISASEVQKQLSNIDAEEIEVHINSYGGDVFESIAIANLLKQKNAKITVVIDGIAASGGSVIAMAGDVIKMPKNTEMMIHNPWTFTYGNAKELRKVADELEKHQDVLEESYLTHFNSTREKLKELLDEETYLTADEALSYGLADEVVSEDKADSLEPEIDDAIVDKIANRVAAKLNKEPLEKVQDSKNKPEKSNLFNLFT